MSVEREESTRPPLIDRAREAMARIDAGKDAEQVNHPAHYGGEDNPYEVVKVAEAWGFDKDAYLFNVLKYIARAGKKHKDQKVDLKKAAWYLARRIMRLGAEEDAG